MAHHRLGQADEARRCLAEASRWIDQANRATENDINGTQSAWGHWQERSLYPLLFREAQDLIEGEGPVTHSANPRPAGVAAHLPG